MVTKYKPKTNILTINLMKSNSKLPKMIQAQPKQLAFLGLTKFMQIHQKPSIWNMTTEVLRPTLISTMQQIKLKMRYL